MSVWDGVSAIILVIPKGGNCWERLTYSMVKSQLVAFFYCILTKFKIFESKLGFSGYVPQKVTDWRNWMIMCYGLVGIHATKGPPITLYIFPPQSFWNQWCIDWIGGKGETKSKYIVLQMHNAHILLSPSRSFLFAVNFWVPFFSVQVPHWVLISFNRSGPY